MGHSLPLPRSLFHKDFLDLTRSLQNVQEIQARKSLIIEFIPRWDLKKSGIKAKLLNATYPQNQLQPELFEKLIVFELYHLLQSKFVDDRRFNNILLLILKTVPKIVKKRMQNYTIDEVLYYFIMVNFILISEDSDAFPRIINLLEYFDGKKSLQNQYLYFMTKQDSTIIRDAENSLREILNMLQFNYSNLQQSKAPHKNEYDTFFDGFIQDKHPEISSSYIQCLIIKIKNSPLNKALSAKAEAEIAKELLPLIPEKYLIFDYYIDLSFSLNLYCNTIALSKKLLNPQNEMSVAKAQCMITILYEVGRLAKIKNIYDGKYFAVKLQEQSIKNQPNSLLYDDFFIERILYGGAVNLEILDSKIANHILNPINYSSQKNLTQLKEKMEPYIKKTDVCGMNMGRPIFNSGMKSRK